MRWAARETHISTACLARSLEESGFAEGSAEAVIVWERFRSAAIGGKWFAAGGLEDGVLSLHMAGIVAKLPVDLVEEMGERETVRLGHGDASKAARLPSAAHLFERACQADASMEAFEERSARRASVPRIPGRTRDRSAHRAPVARARVWWAAEEAKRRLSFEPEVMVGEEALATIDGKPLLSDAGKGPSDLGAILLVGGSTRAPLVARLIEERTGLTPRGEIHPDLCVVLGAGSRA